MKPRLKCPECEFDAVYKKDLLQHLKFHKKGPKKGPKMKLFCERCSFVTDCKSRLLRHVMVHTKEKPYACGECYYQASQKEHVLRHLQAKHGIQVTAPEVKRVRTKRRKVDGGASGNDTAEPQQSGDEGPSTQQDDHSPSRIRRKRNKSDFCTQEKHFACNFCTMKFTKLINLHKHVHIQHCDLYSVDHSQFCCVVCNYTTTSRKNLLVHMRKHTFPQEMEVESMAKSITYAFSCVLCDFSSEHRDHVYAHMKREHNMYLVDSHGVKVTGDQPPKPPKKKTQLENSEEKDDECGDEEGAGAEDDEAEEEDVEPPKSTDALVVALPPTIIDVPVPHHIPVTSSTASSCPPVSPTASTSVACSVAASASRKTVLVQLAPGGPVTSVQIDPPQKTELSLDDLVSTDKLSLVDLMDTPDIVSDVITVDAETESTATLPGVQTVVGGVASEGSQSQTAVSQPVVGEESTCSSGSGQRDKIKLSVQQLSQLARGDCIQINGEMYTVEVTEN